ncbi:MAG: hypothetical protein R3267_07510 [Paenisporosarcina sp.]|nr:hypothetical protein [Paenisporosarcina sp.]
MDNGSLEGYLLSRVDEYVERFAQQEGLDSRQKEEFKQSTEMGILRDEDLVVMCKYMGIPKEKVLEYFSEEDIIDSMQTTFNEDEYIPD